MKIKSMLTLLVLVSASAITAETPPSLTTPNKVESRIGPLVFKDGMPSKETLAKVYDNLDFTHAFEAFVNTMQGVNAEAIRKGFADIGVKDNEAAGVLQADGCEVAVPDGECGHRLFRRRTRPQQGSDGARDAAEGARHHRRRVVALGHRFRRARPRPRRRRQISDPAARLRRSGARRRILCCARRTSRVLVLGRMFMEKDDPQAGGRSDPQVHEDLSVRGRRRGHEHRGVPGRQGRLGRDHSAAARPCSTKAAAR